MIPEDMQEKTEFSKKTGQIHRFFSAVRTYPSAEGNQTVSFSIEAACRHTSVHQLLISNVELLLYL